jgi:DNA-damage-inducible protein D
MSKLHNEVESLFNGKEVRRSRLGEQSLYAAVDVVKVLSDQPDPAEHWKDLKAWNRNITGLARHVKVPQPDGTWAELEMLTTEQVLRLVQSIDSPKAERIRLWLAETGHQRLEEAADPELAIKRTRTVYEGQGYSRDWIQKRIRSMGARHELTGQWYRRGATESEQYRVLTNELSRGTFGMDVEQYRRHKNLRAENLRDHMSDLELALLTLGETTAAILHRDRDSIGQEDLERDVRDAGEIAGLARQEIERRTGKSVPTPDNYVRPLFRRTRRVNAA